jgi:hypothetical protein
VARNILSAGRVEEGNGLVLARPRLKVASCKVALGRIFRHVNRKLCWLFLLGSRAGFGVTHFPGTIVALLLDVIALRKRGNPGSCAAKLSDVLQDDLRSSVVLLQGPMDFDDPTLQLTNVAYAFQIPRKYDNGKRDAR